MDQQGTTLFKALAKALYVAAALVVVLWLLYRIERVILASSVALILAVAINAPVTWLERKNIPRAIGTVLAFFVILITTILLGRLVIPRLAEEIPTLIEEVPVMVQGLVEQITAAVGDQPEIQRQLERVVDWLFGIFEGLWQYTDVVAGALIVGIFVLALTLYMVANLRAILRWYVKSMPSHLRDPATRAFARASEMVLGWVVASVILGGIKAVAAFGFLTLMDVPGAIVWSVLAFFGAFIPRVGFYLMTIPPVVVAITVSPMTAVWTLAFYVVFSEILGNFIAPKVYADRMQLNAVFILFMTLAMGYAFGMIGVLIAAPIAGFLKVYYDEFYLARQPEDPQLEERVQAMMERDSERAEELEEQRA